MSDEEREELITQIVNNFGISCDDASYIVKSFENCRRMEVDRMSNIEDDVNNLGAFCLANIIGIISQEEFEDVKKSIKNILSEREQDKARIKELEEELYSANKIVEEYLDGIPKQKIKDKIENLEKEYKKLEQSSDFIIADTIQPKIEVLQELLQESEEK